MKNPIKVSEFAHHPSLIKNGASTQKMALSTYGIMIVLLNIYKLDPAFKIFTIAFSGKSDDKVRSGKIWTLFTVYRKMALPCKKWHHLLMLWVHTTKSTY